MYVTLGKPFHKKQKIQSFFILRLSHHPNRMQKWQRQQRDGTNPTRTGNLLSVS
jgi:hypothetical protein